MSETRKKPTAKKPTTKRAAAKKTTAKPSHGLQGILLRHKLGTKHVAFALAVLLTLSYVLAVYTAFTTSFIPGKYIGLGFLTSFVVITIIVMTLVRQTVQFRTLVAVMVVASISIFVNLGIFIAGSTANSFIKSLQEDAVSYEEYAIVALKEKTVKLETPSQTIGILLHDATDDVKTAVKEKTPAAVETYPTPTESLLALEENRAHMALYTTAYMRELQQLNNNEIYQKLEILATIRVKVTSQKASANVSEPFVVYVSGIDTYGEVSKTSRSDVNIIMAVNPKTHKVLLVNTPRDYYVQLHGTTGTKDKLTHAGLYGVSTSVKTLEDLYGVSINYNMRINFTSLEKVVNAMGGIEVNSEYDFSSGGFRFNAGKNYLNGKQALAFSRERYSFEGGDRTRGQNQMKLITAIIEKMSQPSMALRAGNVLQAVSDVIETNMPNNALNSLIRTQLDTMAKWNVTSTSVDGYGASEPTYSMGAQRLYVMIPDEASVQSARRQLQSTL